MTKALPQSQPVRAIIRIIVSSKNISHTNYSRRMYAIIRRYTPEAAEGGVNECLADLTGLRTFFKMTYTEIAESIVKDLRTEIGLSFNVKVTSVYEFEKAIDLSKKSKTVSTYKEMNNLFAGKSFVETPQRKIIRTASTAKKIRLTVPYLGKVA